MIPYVFRPTTADFWKWIHQYVLEAHLTVKMGNWDPKFSRTEDFAFAQKICRQYRTLLASLSKKERELVENKLIKGKVINFSDKEERIAFSNIFNDWQEICFPGGKNHLKRMSMEEFGAKITALREKNGYTRQHVADLLDINVATLKAYEYGNRMIRLDLADLLAQIYGVGLEELV